MKVNSSPFGRDRDLFFMQQALEQAQLAYAQDEVPVGAVVVSADGTIIARAYNQVEMQHTQRAHAESLAIEKAGKKIKNWRLTGCWVYVTLEPCSTCMHLVALSRVEGIVFGADSLLFGYRLDKKTPDWLYKKGVVRVVENIAADTSAKLLKVFFQEKRKKGECNDNIKKIRACSQLN